MKELLTLLRKLDFKALFLSPSQNFMVQAFRYVFVGGVAFLADWGCLYLFSLLHLHYLAATAFAFVIGLIVNFLLSKKFVFTEDAKKTGKMGEFITYGIIGAIGLVLTELLMYVITDLWGLHFMLSKLIVAVIVLAWNFIARKVIIYR